MRGGTGADRQLRAYEQTGDLRSVVDHIVAETAEGVRPEIVSYYSSRQSSGERYRAIKLGDNASRQTQGAT
jgi:hypothetical protein